MLRQAFAERLKEAMKARDARTLATVRLILATLKERDVAARAEGRSEGIGEPEIHRMLQGMIKQRRESAALYEKGNRPDLAGKEREEIAVIESFLPQQMGEDEIAAAARAPCRRDRSRPRRRDRRAATGRRIAAVIPAGRSLCAPRAGAALSRRGGTR